jgi:hypothetical protein
MRRSFAVSEVSLKKVLAEVKLVRVQLKSIERALDSLVYALIPEEEISPKLQKELEKRKRDIEKGKVELVPLEEVLKKHLSSRRTAPKASPHQTKK